MCCGRASAHVLRVGASQAQLAFQKMKAQKASQDRPIRGWHPTPYISAAAVSSLTCSGRASTDVLIGVQHEQPSDEGSSAGPL